MQTNMHRGCIIFPAWPINNYQSARKYWMARSRHATCFLQNLVSKLGLEVQVFRVGTYKSAVEPFIATEMSPANREQMTECLESVWHRILADVSDSRRIPTDTLNAYADRYMDFVRQKNIFNANWQIP